MGLLVRTVHLTVAALYTNRYGQNMTVDVIVTSSFKNCGHVTDGQNGALYVYIDSLVLVLVSVRGKLNGI